MKKLISSLIITVLIGVGFFATGCQSQPKVNVAPQKTSKTMQSTTEVKKTTPSTTKAPHISSRTEHSTSIQCSGYTKHGKRCQRKTTDPSGYCWQHK